MTAAVQPIVDAVAVAASVGTAIGAKKSDFAILQRENQQMAVERNAVTLAVVHRDDMIQLARAGVFRAADRFRDAYVGQYMAATPNWWREGDVNWLDVTRLVQPWERGLDPQFDPTHQFLYDCWRDPMGMADAIEAAIRANVPEDPNAPRQAQIDERVAEIDARNAANRAAIAQIQAELSAIEQALS